MTTNALLVTDLGPGDGGKGGVVHRAAIEMNAHTIFKVGGAQGSHGVRTSSGEHFAFSQLGCGTFEGRHTHITRNFVFDPGALWAEMHAMYTSWRIDAQPLLTIDADALMTNIIYTSISRLSELALGTRSRGTIGSGVGIAYRESLSNPERALYARDIGTPRMRAVLYEVFAWACAESKNILDRGSFLPEDKAEIEDALRLLKAPAAEVVERICAVATLVKSRVVDTQYISERILSKEGAVILESSHGVLTDFYFGFQPHTSKLRTLPQRHIDMLRTYSYTGPLQHFGISRAYQIRHGAGPLPTDSGSLRETLLPGSNKGANRYQGQVRVGPLDFVLLRYAIQCCGGPQAFTGIALTWFDQMLKNGYWDTCSLYENTELFQDVFRNNSHLRVGHHSENMQQIWYMQSVTEALNMVVPTISRTVLQSDFTQEALVQLVSERVQNELKVPLTMLSLGPTEREKVCL
jgi:adenylosuccinate synthase